MKTEPSGMPEKAFDEAGLGPLSPQAKAIVRAHNDALGKIQKLPLPERTRAMARLTSQYQRMWDETEAAQKKVAVPIKQKAPQRVYSYDVSMGGANYRLTLAEQLPADAVAARKRLHDLMTGTTVLESGGAVNGDVQMLGATPGATAFNKQPPNARMDKFRDRYVGRTLQDGEYAEDESIAISSSVKKRGV
jgi:hypothetical protein